MAGENWTLWLNMTNFALGIVTLLALLVVFAAVGWDLLVRKVHTARNHSGLDLNNLDGELQAMLQGIAQPVRTRSGADDGRRGRENRAFQVEPLQTRNTGSEPWLAPFLKKVEHDIATLRRCTN